MGDLVLTVSGKRPISALLIAVALLSLFTASTGQPQKDERKALERDFPVLSKRVRESQPADFVIAVDRSGSMKRFWPEVKRGAIAFIEAIPDGDYVSVVGFGTAADNLVVPRAMNSESRGALVKELSALSDPSEQNTDIGLGIQKILDELNRPNGNRLKFLFILTDFEHEPPRASSFAGQFSATDREWTRLAERARNEQGSNNVQSFALLLPLGANVGKHLSLGKTVFPGMQSLAVSGAALVEWFERRKVEIAREKLRSEVDFDSRRPPFAVKDVIQRGNRLYAVTELVTDRVVDTYAISGVRADGITVEIVGTSITPISETLERIVITDENRGKPIEIPIAEITDAGNWIGESFNGRISFKIKGSQELQPAEELAKLDLAPSREFELAETDRPVGVKIGLLQLWMIAAAIVGLVILAFAAWRRVRSEYISGQITVIGHGVPHEFQKAEKRTHIMIGNVNESPDNIRVEDVRWVVEIRGFPSSERKRGIYMKIDGSTAALEYDDESTPLSTVGWNKLPEKGFIVVGGGQYRIQFSVLR